jgi:GNAT superfamily N-acetyltransferase
MAELNWNHPSRLHSIVCRPALPKDTPDVMELTRTIWDGHDYIPHVWNDWLADSHGLLASAEYKGQVVGLGKLTRLAEQQWWLEGLRVHPDYQGRHIASHIMEYLYDYWKMTASGAIRLATASYRLSVQHLCDRFGFQKLGEFSEFSAPAISFTGSAAEIGFSPVQAGQEAEAAQFARQCASLDLSHGFIDLGYQWASPDTIHFIKTTRESHAWWWHTNKGLLMMMDWREDDDQISSRIMLIGCQITDLPTMLQDARRLTAIKGHARLGWIASLQPELQPILQAASFKRDWEEAVFVYEKTRTN